MTKLDLDMALTLSGLILGALGYYLSTQLSQVKLLRRPGPINARGLRRRRAF
jgi:hypothetical protein